MLMENAQDQAVAGPTPAQLADELAAVMAQLWATVAQVEPEEIEMAQLAGGWTPKALVAHVAFWDDYQRQRMEAAYAGASRTGFIRPTLDNDARAAEDGARPWAEVQSAAVESRRRLVDFARSLSPAQLTQEFPEGARTFVPLRQLQHMVRHVREHQRELEIYCGSVARWGKPGLRRLMVEHHAHLMDGMGGLTEATMLTTPVCGVWTIRDLLAHVLSWNEYASRLLRQWPEADPAEIAEWQWRAGETMAEMNARLMAERTDLTMIEIADGLTTEYRRMLRVFDATDEEALTSVGMTWDGLGRLDGFFYAIFLHEAEHAAQLWAFRAGELEVECAHNRTDDA
jgi:hypothetical protein